MRHLLRCRVGRLLSRTSAAEAAGCGVSAQGGAGLSSVGCSSGCEAASSVLAAPCYPSFRTAASAAVAGGRPATQAPRDYGGGPSRSGSGGGGRSMGPIILLPAAVAAGLSAWQLVRRGEKQAMLDQRLAAMQVRRLQRSVNGMLAPPAPVCVRSCAPGVVAV